ncbi:hypothetical protein ACH42_16095 [Endozoicomonas sp. (ex Bugula neritina AB1)]|nr:hypothetical protein ACH42_16095 [Endozoicomonas sp. (ex Bugula neritina AB1)]
MDDNSGFNEVNGTGGDDDLVGTSGNDALNGGEGSDTYDGGDGSDRYILSDLDAVDTLNFQSSDDQQDIIDVSALLPDGQVTADNLQQFVKINSSGVFLDSAGAGEFSEENRVARFDSNSSVNSNLVSVQIAASTVVEFDWMATGDDPLMDSSSYTNDSNPDLVRGTYQADTLNGTAADNILAGGAGDDVLNGGEGADTYHGGAGNDTYVLSTSGDVEILNFKSTTAEKDVLDISGLLPAEANATNLSNYLNITADGVYLDVTGAGVFDEYVKIAEFTEDSIFTKDLIQVKIPGDSVVSFSVDPLIGVQPGDSSTFVNQTIARSLIDKLTEDGTSSMVSSDNNAGFIRSSAGQKLDIDLNDNNITVAHGGAGDEILDASNVEVAADSVDSAKLYGRAGNDTLTANADDNYLDGGLGNDLIISGEGKNILLGGEGRDEFQLTMDASTDPYTDIVSDMLYDFSSQEGNRDILDLSLILPAEATEDNIHQYVQVTDAGVYIDVSGGADFSKTNELVRLGEKVDMDHLVDIRLADDSLIQMNLLDVENTFNGTSGDDTLHAGQGIQTLNGGDGNDTLDGDILDRGNSVDHLYGGKGNDRLHVDQLDLTEGTVDGGEGVDQLMMKYSDESSVSIDMKSINIESALTGQGDDTLDATGFTAAAGSYDAATGNFVADVAQRVTLYGRNGEDTLKGGEGNDYLDGGAGNDRLFDGDGRDMLLGNAGNDIYVLADDNHIDKMVGFKATTSEADAIDITELVPDGFTESQLPDYLHLSGEFVYFDSTGQGSFFQDQIIARFAWGSIIEEPVRVIFNGTETTMERNDAPEVSDTITGTLQEDGTLILTQADLLVNAIDPDGDSLTATNLRVLGRGSVTGNNDGTFSVTPEADYNGVLRIDYDITDSYLTVSSRLDLTVESVNDGPVVNNLTDDIIEDQSYTITATELLRSASDVDGDTLTLESVSVVNDTGVIIDNGDDTYTFRPKYNLGNTDAIIEYVISDGVAATTGNYTLSIDSVSDAAKLLVKAFDVGKPVESLETADFSEATEGVLFDITKHTLQTVGGGVETNAWNATEVNGSDHDDVFTFNDLQAGDSYTINGGGGHNILNLDNYRGDQVTINHGTRTITVDVDEDGNTATINYSNISNFDFRSDVFDGTPHGVEANDFGWEINGTELHVDSTGSENNFAIALVDFEGSLDENFILDAEVNAHSQDAEDYHNGAIIFDYQDDNNYKYVVARIGSQKWRIEEVVDGFKSNLVALPASIPQDTFVGIQLKVEGSTVSLVSGGEVQVSHDFGETLNDGRIGVMANNAKTSFKLDMAPTNWAPAVTNYDVEMQQSDDSYLTANVLEDATDPLNEVLVVSGFTQGANGTVIDNGDGTFSYVPDDDFSGLDTFTYEVSDGTNVTTGEIRINVLANGVLELEEGGIFQMDVASELIDTDGSESLRIVLDGNPVGSEVTDGTNTFTVTEDALAVDISDWDLTQIRVTPPEDYYGWFHSVVRAQATEDNGEVRETVNRLQVRVSAVNDAPETIDNTLVMNEDSVYQFHVDDFNFSDVDKSNRFVSIAIDTLPDIGVLTVNDVVIRAGRQVPFADIENLKLTTSAIDADTEVSFEFTVSDGMYRSEAKTFTLDLRDTSVSTDIMGTDNAEILVGTDEADAISAGSGDDTLVSSAGDDILTGGDGSDIFVWRASDHADEDSDTITDFHTGVGGDVIDLSDVLIADTDQLENFLNINFVDGDTTIEVKPAADDTVTQKITLEGVDLSSYGGGATDAEIINNLIDDGNLMM